MNNNELNSTHDKDIIQDIEKELLLNEEVSTNNVSIDVQSNKVIITGSVETLEEKQEIEDMISNINGVALVVNNLKIEKI